MINNIDPVLFSFGPLAIRYYGLIYMSGFIIAYFFLKYYGITRGHVKNLTKKDLDDFIFYNVIGVVVGARLFEILFYDPGYYFSHPSKMLALWEGGLSFHGGLFGVAATTLIFCKVKKIAPLRFGDVISIPAALAHFFGRFANFLNSELYGKVLPQKTWYAVKFIRSDEAMAIKNKILAAQPELANNPDLLQSMLIEQVPWRLPTQLFESLKNLFIFAVLVLLFKYREKLKLKDGFIFWVFMILYGSIRFVIEAYKDVYVDTFHGLSTGQLLCIPMVLIGIGGIIYVYLRKPKLEAAALNQKKEIVKKAKKKKSK
ncbi:MAG TPA: prolipoprotein diacylglyceryl transferase [Spirochaetia bacterium]|nr:MAG: prolipoprotein diacylglyceryl transferase [Spirochaetes bacterium GWB1_36_13]HCL55744.1 prolipoprotein diacylglyceryl transferase [Spirochaetia bacterium]